MTQQTIGIHSFGAYSPRLRLQRKAIAAANAWFNPSLAGQAKGERSMANWDEDAVTMAVEAARDALPDSRDPLTSRAQIGALYFASTTPRCHSPTDRMPALCLLRSACRKPFTRPTLPGHSARAFLL